MTEHVTRQMHLHHFAFARGVARWSAAVWALGTAALLTFDRQAALGLAVGGGIGVSLFVVHWSLARMWRHPLGLRRARRWLWVILAVKWPVMGTLLYLAVSRAWAAPAWICVGAGVVPGVATILCFAGLLRARLRRPASAEVGP